MRDHALVECACTLRPKHDYSGRYDHKAGEQRCNIGKDSSMLSTCRATFVDLRGREGHQRHATLHGGTSGGIRGFFGPSQSLRCGFLRRILGIVVFGRLSPELWPPSERLPALAP